MGVLPNTKIEQIQFCEAHLPVWNAAPPATIGLSSTQLSTLTALTTTARKSFDDAQLKRQASKTATQTLTSDTAAMRSFAADLIAQIKAFADLQSNPNAIYDAAQIPLPSPPTPATAPGVPESIVVTLETSGAVTLSWDATNAAASTGAVFVVGRKLPGQASYNVVGFSPGSTTESRRMIWTDNTVPTSAASAGVQYIITGQRAGMMGTPSNAIVVQFGVDGAGATVTGATLNMAA